MLTTSPKPRRAKAPRMSETSLVGACIQLLTLRGCFVWRQNQGAVKAEYKGKTRFLRFAGAEGISDIVGMTPAGRFLAVECKIAPNKPTPEQTQFLATVRKRGGLSLLIYSIDQLINAMNEEGI